MEFPCRAFLCACGGRYAPPPHARGIQRAAHAAGRLRRFIPTCVRNTTFCCIRSMRDAVHPHMRGEYAACPRGMPHRAGSSPHAWGIRPPDAAPGQGQRFIPTCVGNTWGLGSGWISEVGSSPHAWGIPGIARRITPYSRFIPTCVGNTAPPEATLRI